MTVSILWYGLLASGAVAILWRVVRVVGGRERTEYVWKVEREP